jgi:hypothetical protein
MPIGFRLRELWDVMDGGIDQSQRLLLRRLCSRPQIFAFVKGLLYLHPFLGPSDSPPALSNTLALLGQIQPL